MAHVSISEPVLRWALERSGRADALLLRFPKLDEWLRGRSRPTLRQLEIFSKATSTPLGYFFLPEPPEERLPIPHFRTHTDEHVTRPSPELLDTVQTMEKRQAWMRDYLVEQGNKRLGFVGSARITEKPDDLAQQIRAGMGLSERWASEQPNWAAALRELEMRMEDAGILVVVSGIVGNNTHRKLDVSEFRGFVLVDDYAPLVFVNGSDSKAAQMFTLVHEAAHVWFGSSAAFDLRELQPAQDKTEQACNIVAAEFLVPTSELLQVWHSVRNRPDRFYGIAQQFKVSEIVAGRRALDLGLVSKDEFFSFYEEYEDRWRKTTRRRQQGGDFYATQNLRIGRRFGGAVVRATMEGRLLYSEAFRLTGLHGKTFDRYAESLGFGKAA